MMLSFKRFFLSRKTILALILLILLSVVIGYIFPQRFSTAPSVMDEWKEAHPFLVPWVEALGLGHVYSTSWFAALLFVFLFSLVISTYEQIKISTKKTFGGLPAGGESFRIIAEENELISAIKTQGYFRAAKNEEGYRFVKRPWGYWGNVLLHIGIVITIASSLLIALTQKRGVLNLVEGEITIPGAPWAAEENGLMAGKFVLPEAVRLEQVIAEFWETDDLKQLTSAISFIDPQGRINKYTLAINQTIDYRGLRIYQSYNSGDAFFVKFVDLEGGRNGVILQIQSPSKRDRASYGNFHLEGTPYLLKAKYFADAGKRSMDSTNPLLVLRLMDKGKVLGEINLRKGESDKIGPYTASFLEASKWAGIIFVDITGMPGIFLGFFIIIAGSGLTYFMPPSEFFVRREGNEFSIAWKATRFESFYKEEFESVLKDIGKDLPL